MKKNIIVAMDNEKFSALKMYSEQKGVTVEDELTKYAEQLYTKVVPQNVRDYIDMVGKVQPPGKPRKAPDSVRNND